VRYLCLNHTLLKKEGGDLTEPALNTAPPAAVDTAAAAAEAAAVNTAPPAVNTAAPAEAAAVNTAPLGNKQPIINGTEVEKNHIAAVCDVPSINVGAQNGGRKEEEMSEEEAGEGEESGGWVESDSSMDDDAPVECKNVKCVSP